MQQPTVEVHGAAVPKLGYGTFQLSGADCERGVAHALERGCRHVDTAQMYRNEAQVGAALRGAAVDRDEVWITTKVDNDHHAPDRVEASTAESLRLLGVDRVDLLLLHWPGEWDELPATLEAMDRVREQGMTRLIGVSNFPPTWLARALQLAPVAANQVEHHPYLDAERLRAMAEADGLVHTAYSPLARGRVLDDPVLAGIAGAHGATVAQVALAWLLAKPATATIPKATSPERIDENLGALHVELSDDEVARIDGLDRGLRTIDPPFAPDWED